jgi:hypothetical protein
MTTSKEEELDIVKIIDAKTKAILKAVQGQDITDCHEVFTAIGLVTGILISGLPEDRRGEYIMHLHDWMNKGVYVGDKHKIIPQVKDIHGTVQ